MVPSIMPGRMTHHSETDCPEYFEEKCVGDVHGQPSIPKIRAISHSTGPCGSRLLTKYISST